MINLRKKTDPTAEVFTSAMNDIMFFLMLFFIIMSTLLNPSMINVALPKSKNSQIIHNKEINLTVTKGMEFFINNTPVTFNMLEPELKKELAKYPSSVIMLRIDNSLLVQDLVNVLSLGSKLNTKITLATKKNP